MEDVKAPRDFLEREFSRRQSRNSGYSMRAYARDLGISVGRLSEIFSGKQGISARSAESIALRMGLPPRERERFVDLAASCHSRNKVIRDAAARRLARSSMEASGQVLPEDVFRFVADWYYFSILELMGLGAFNEDPQWIASRLGISAEQAREAMQRLERMALIVREDGRWKPATAYTFSTSGIPSAAVREAHRQVIIKALDAVTKQSVAERDLSAMILAFDSTRIREAMADIKAFRRDFTRKYALSESKDSVYALAMQFFRLDRNN